MSASLSITSAVKAPAKLPIVPQGFLPKLRFFWGMAAGAYILYAANKALANRIDRVLDKTSSDSLELGILTFSLVTGIVQLIGIVALIALGRPPEKLVASIVCAFTGLYQANHTLSRNSEDQLSSDPEKMLGRYALNLNECVKQKPLPVGRERELDAMLAVLLKQDLNNPILLGESGVGKTAIVEMLAHKINRNEVPGELKGKTIYALNMVGLIGGTQLRGSFEQKLAEIQKAVRALEGNAILFIDEIHMMVGAGSNSTPGSGPDMGNLFKPVLTDPSFICIGATTEKEYQKYFSYDPALRRRFSPIRVPEMDEVQTMAVLQKFKCEGIDITQEARKAAYDLAQEHLEGHFPAKAVDLLDMACALLIVQRYRQQESSSQDLQELPVDLIRTCVANKSGKRLDEIVWPISAR